MHEISGVNRTHFCGAYWGAGFHEDGAASGLRAAREIGTRRPVVVVIYEGTVRHRRFAVREHAFRHRVAFAYTELDHPPAFVPDTGGPVMKLTLPKRFGKAFNPVSFYYCFDPAERLEAVVAEVTSTPWGDRHAVRARVAPATARC